MITTSETLSVNGVVLNTLAMNIESLTGRLRVPSLRTPNVTLPGRHGTLRTVQKMYDEGQIVLPMWVRGSNEDGEILENHREEFYSNLDILSRLFRDSSGLLEVLHTLPDGSVRRAMAECTEVIDFSAKGGIPLGKFSVALKVPSVFWEDQLPTSVDLDIAHNGPVNQLQGGTAPIEDAVFVIHGPAVNPRIESMVDGQSLEVPNWFQYNGTVELGDTLTVDCANWELSSTGFTLSYSNFTHSGGARWLTLYPGSGDGIPQVEVSAFTTGSESKVVLTARRKFLVG